MRVSTDRNVAIDGMRVLAAVSVTLIHVCAIIIGRSGPDFGVLFVDGLAHWGLPFFFAVSGYLHAHSSRAKKSRGAWRMGRLTRLGVPYIAWSIVYVAYSTAMSLADGSGIPGWNILTILLVGGASSTLWFLPAVFYSAIAISLLPRRGAVLAMCGAAFAADLIVVGHWLPLPDHYFINRMPVAFLCYAAGYLLHDVSRETLDGLSRAAGITAVSLSTVFAATGAWSASLGSDQHYAPLLGALSTHFLSLAGILALVWALHERTGTRLAALSPFARYTMGQYLSHTLFAMLAIRFFPPREGTPPLGWVAVMFPLVLGASYAVTASLLAMPYTRWMVGESTRPTPPPA